MMRSPFSKLRGRTTPRKANQMLVSRLGTGLRHPPYEERVRQLFLYSLLRLRIRVDLMIAFQTLAGFLGVDSNSQLALFAQAFISIAKTCLGKVRADAILLHNLHKQTSLNIALIFVPYCCVLINHNHTIVYYQLGLC